MATNVRILAAGLVKNGALFAEIAPATSKSWVINTLVLTNLETASASVLNVTAAKTGATFYHVAPKDLSIPGGSSVVLEYDLLLMAPASGAADKLRLELPSGFQGALGVSYVASGVERDVAL